MTFTGLTPDRSNSPHALYAGPPMADKRPMISVALAMLLGPISKYDDRPPILEITSARSLGELQRCLVDMNNWPAPMVYRQDDRPNDITLIYTGPGGQAYGRVDLRADGLGKVLVRSWLKSDQVAACAK